MSQSAVSLCVAIFLFPLASSGEYKLEMLKEALPSEVAAPLRDSVHVEGLRVVDPKGKPLVDLWLRKEVPPAPPREPELGLKFGALTEGSFLAVARYHQKHYDFKNKPIPPGLYTLRHGVQPRDGDHLGVSDTRDFALLCPAGADKALAPLPTEESVKLSCQVSGAKHPSVVWLKPLIGERKDLPALVSEKDHEYQVLEFQIPIQGEKQKAVRMGLVVVGSAPEV